MEAGLHPAETERLDALRGYEILDTPRESDFDDIVKVTSLFCDTPVSVVNLIDDGRQWFKAEVGLGVRETPLPASICAHAILESDLLIVPDTLEDVRFSDNPLVVGKPGFRFYAGAILRTSQGLPLGTVCVLDYRPRSLNENQKLLLQVMANQVMQLLEARRLARSEHNARDTAERALKENEILARESDHRVMNSLQLVSSVLALQSRNASPQAKPELEDARRRVDAIATVHRELHMTGNTGEVEIRGFLKRLCESIGTNAPEPLKAIHIKSSQARLSSEFASSLGLVVAELIANSFKHAFPNGRTGAIEVEFSGDSASWRLCVMDDGLGLPAGFDPAKSKGVGLRVVSALVKRLDAKLSFENRKSGSLFTVTSVNEGSEAVRQSK